MATTPRVNSKTPTISPISGLETAVSSDSKVQTAKADHKALSKRCKENFKELINFRQVANNRA